MISKNNLAILGGLSIFGFSLILGVFFWVGNSSQSDNKNDRSETQTLDIRQQSQNSFVYEDKLLLIGDNKGKDSEHCPTDNTCLLAVHNTGQVSILDTQEGEISFDYEFLMDGEYIYFYTNENVYKGGKLIRYSLLTNTSEIFAEFSAGISDDFDPYTSNGYIILYTTDNRWNFISVDTGDVVTSKAEIIRHLALRKASNLNDHQGITIDNNFYFLSIKGLVSVDITTGQTNWVQNEGVFEDMQSGLVESALKYVDGKLLLLVNGKMDVISSSDGSIIEEVQLESPLACCRGSVIVVDGSIYYTVKNKLQKIALAGKLQQSIELTPTDVEWYNLNNIYVVDGYLIVDLDSHVSLIDIVSFELVKSYESIDNSILVVNEEYILGWNKEGYFKIDLDDYEMTYIVESKLVNVINSGLFNDNLVSIDGRETIEIVDIYSANIDL